jgi:hypothetical protein
MLQLHAHDLVRLIVRTAALPDILLQHQEPPLGRGRIVTT